MQKKYAVTLTETERIFLEKLVRSGTAATRKLAHARILFKAGDHQPGGYDWSAAAIADAVEAGVSSVARVKQRCVTAGLDAALALRPATAPTARSSRGVTGR